MRWLASWLAASAFTLAYLTGALFLDGVRQPPIPSQPSAPIIMPPCASDDPCPDPAKPWMRGTIEVQCAMPEKVDEKRAAAPGAHIVSCGVCRHVCNPFDPNAKVTGGRSWDPMCGARCKPSGCACPNPCDS